MNSNLKQTCDKYAKITTAKEAATILGISRSTVYKMVERNLIGYIEYPNALRFFESEIFDYLRSHRIEAGNRKKTKEKTVKIEKAGIPL